MRALKLFSAYLLVVVIIMSIIFIPNWDDFTTVFENTEGLSEGTEWIEKTYSMGGLVEYLVEQPQYTAMASDILTNNPQTKASYDLRLNADRPQTMGTLQYLPLAVALYQLHDRQVIDITTEIALEDISAYQLPNYYMSGHTQAKAWIQEHRNLSDGTASIHDLLTAGIANNDFAIHDFLLDTYNLEDEIIALSDSLTLDPLLPFAGIAVALHPNLHNTDFKTLFNESKALSDSLWRAQVQQAFESWITPGKDRDEIISAFREDDYGINFLQEKASYDLYPKVSANSMNALMREALFGDILSQESRDYLIDNLNWVMEDDIIRNQFANYGGAYESRIGLLNGFDFGKVDESDSYRLQTIFFDQVPIALWFHLSSNFMNQDFQRRLIWDPELRERTHKAISTYKDTADFVPATSN